MPVGFDEPGAVQEMITGSWPPVVVALQETGRLAVPDESQLADRTKVSELIVTVKSWTGVVTSLASFAWTVTWYVPFTSKIVEKLPPVPEPGVPPGADQEIVTGS